MFFMPPDLTLPPDTSTADHCFCFDLTSSFLLKLFLCSSPVAYWALTNLGSSSFHTIPFCLFILFMGSQKDGKIMPQQDGRKGTITFKIKSLTHQRCSEGRNKNFVCIRTQEKEQWPSQETNQTCLWVFECLLRRHRSAVTCCGDRSSGRSTPGRLDMWYTSSWRRSPLAHYRATEQMTHKLENNYTKDVLALLQKF